MRQVVVNRSANERYSATGLRARLDQRGISHAWLARRVGISPQQLSHVLMGRRTVSPETCAAIAAELGTPEDELFAPAPPAGGAAG